MSYEVSSVKSISDMFTAFVRNNKVEPAQIEDVVRAIVRGLSASGTTAFKPQFRPQPKPLPEVEAEPVRLVEVPSEEQRCSIMHLTDHTCRWPIGDPTSQNFCFCGRTPREKSPYCEYHASISFFRPSRAAQKAC